MAYLRQFGKMFPSFVVFVERMTIVPMSGKTDYPHQPENYFIKLPFSKF